MLLDSSSPSLALNSNLNAVWGDKGDAFICSVHPHETEYAPFRQPAGTRGILLSVCYNHWGSPFRNGVPPDRDKWGSAWRVDAPPDGGGAGRIKLIFYPIWKMDFQKAARRSLLRQYNELCKWSVIRGIARIVQDPYLSVRHPNPTPSRCVVQFECKRTIQWRAALAVSFGQFIRWLHNYSFMNLLPLFIFYSNNGIAIIISRTIDKRND